MVVGGYAIDIQKKIWGFIMQLPERILHQTPKKLS
jgi:hypothetical protein